MSSFLPLPFPSYFFPKQFINSSFVSSPRCFDCDLLGFQVGCFSKMEYLDWTFLFICCFLILLDDRWWTLEKLFHSISSSNFDYFYQYFDILSDTLSEIFARCFGRLYFWKLYKKIQCYIIQGKKFFLSVDSTYIPGFLNEMKYLRTNFDNNSEIRFLGTNQILLISSLPSL